MATSTGTGRFRILAALALTGVFLAISANSATTFVVNDKGDDGEGDLADNECVAVVLIAGKQCTLRAAIQQLDAVPASTPRTGA